MLITSVTVEVGVNEAVAAPQLDATAPPTEHVSVSGAATPANGVSVAVVLVPSPAITVPDGGLMMIVKSMPLPVIVTFKPLYSKLLEFTPTVPFWGPIDVGRNVTLTAQVASAASVLPQAAVLTEYWPVVTNTGTGSGAPPGIANAEVCGVTAPARLVNVMFCEAEAPTSRLPKLSVVGDSENPGVPVPVSDAVSVFPAETTASVPVRSANALGVNTTTIWQLAPPATEAQLFDVILKSVLFPLMAADVTCETKLELFVQVKVFGWLG